MMCYVCEDEGTIPLGDTGLVFCQACVNAMIRRSSLTEEMDPRIMFDHVRLPARSTLDDNALWNYYGEIRR